MSQLYNPTWKAVEGLILAAKALLEAVAPLQDYRYDEDVGSAVEGTEEALRAFESPQHRATTTEAARAEAEHECDEVEIDTTPLVSRTEDGCWVSASVWVPKPDEDED